MSGDGLIWLILLLTLSAFNYMAISLNNRNKMSLWLSGIIIGVLGPVIAYIVGSILVSIDHSSGDSGVGPAIGAAFIGLVIVANGVLYIIIGIVSMVKKLDSGKNSNPQIL